MATVSRLSVTPVKGLALLEPDAVDREPPGIRDGKHADFGVYADVERPGRVRVGDPVELREG